MAITVPTSLESISGFTSSLRTRVNRDLEVERRVGAGSTIRAEDANAPILMAHLARSRIPRNFAFYTPDGISTDHNAFLTVLTTKHTISAATTDTLDLIVRASGDGQVRVLITDGSTTDNRTFSTTASEATYSNTLDISGMFANAECTITVQLKATTGSENLFGVFIAPQNMTSSDLA